MESQESWNFCVDFLVVGMGAGGALVMRRLKDAGLKVMAVEAGGNYDNDPLIYDSANAGLLEPEYSWKFLYQKETVPNPNAGGKVLNHTTGRMLGGGTSINGEQYVRSTPDYWNEWASIVGDDNWNGVNVYQNYKNLESYIGYDFDNIHGYNGLMNIKQAPVKKTRMATKLADALSLMSGKPVVNDYNNPGDEVGSFTRWSLFQNPDGTRASSSTNFLKPILGDILINTTVVKVIFGCGNKVIGVNAIHNGKCIKIRVFKEVILACGIYSPEILERSGIGGKDLLNSINIPVVYDNPFVGYGSKNHLINFANFKVNPVDIPGTGNDPNAIYTGGAFLPKADDTSNKRGFQWIGVNVGDQLLVLFYNLTPQSIGTDHLQDKDPFRIAKMDEQLFTNPNDLQDIINVYQQQIVPLAQYLAVIDPEYQLLSPPLNVIQDTALLTDFINSTLEHAHHWTGTCKMAPLNQGGVVDNEGRVYGVTNLRVADISVGPIQPNGNTAGPATMVGYIVSNYIIKKYTK